jgi:hypothetical protein
MILAGKIRRTRRKTCVSAFSVTNPTWAGLGLNPDLHSEMVVNKPMSHSTVDIAYRPQMHNNSVIFPFWVSLHYSQKLITTNLDIFCRILHRHSWSAKCRKKSSNCRRFSTNTLCCVSQITKRLKRVSYHVETHNVGLQKTVSGTKTSSLY